jgi:pyrimidine-nucleoside phosphorylase
VKAQGGDPSAISDLTKLPRAKSMAVVGSRAAGFVQGIDSEAVGLAAMALGAGRERTDSVIDPAVGFVLEKKVGDAVQVGEPLVTVHYNDASKLEAVRARVLAAYRIGAGKPAPRPLVLERME